uniref:Uncharacterized protein n=1 Tax=Arion vulgaris TaxID=1028688 RepID=A0A0B7BX58_9EUPU
MYNNEMMNSLRSAHLNNGKHLSEKAVTEFGDISNMTKNLPGIHHSHRGSDSDVDNMLHQ